MMEMYHYTESGLRNVWLRNGFTWQDTPYGQGISIDDVTGLHKTLAQELVMQSGRLSGTEIRFLRKEMELSQTALAACLGVNAQTIALWEKGKARISGPADRMLRIMVKGHFSSNVHVKRLIEALNNREQVRQENRMVFQETGSQWQQVA